MKCVKCGKVLTDEDISYGACKSCEQSVESEQ